jgi:hypothetical protein
VALDCMAPYLRDVAVELFASVSGWRSEVQRGQRCNGGLAVSCSWKITNSVALVTLVTRHPHSLALSVCRLYSRSFNDL